ncbi:MAG: hypothetical protein HXX81_00230 [Campylobacterales bacterium]|nr:hypothetical protein [Campylobacterales bacterium]
MYEYEPLEQKWKKYRLNRVIKLTILSFFVIFTIVYISISILNKDIEKTNIEISKQLEEEKKIVVSEQNITKQEQVLVVPKYTPQPLPNVKENIEKPIIEEQIEPSSEEIKDKVTNKKMEQKESLEAKQLFLNSSKQIEEETISLHDEQHEK